MSKLMPRPDELARQRYERWQQQEELRCQQMSLEILKKLLSTGWGEEITLRIHRDALESGPPLQKYVEAIWTPKQLLTESVRKHVSEVKQGESWLPVILSTLDHVLKHDANP